MWKLGEGTLVGWYRHMVLVQLGVFCIVIVI